MHGIVGLFISTQNSTNFYDRAPPRASRAFVRYTKKEREQSKNIMARKRKDISPRNKTRIYTTCTKEIKKRVKKTFMNILYSYTTYQLAHALLFFLIFFLFILHLHDHIQALTMFFELEQVFNIKRYIRNLYWIKGNIVFIIMYIRMINLINYLSSNIV